MARRRRPRRDDRYLPDFDELPEPDDPDDDGTSTTVTLEQYRQGERPT